MDLPTQSYTYAEPSNDAAGKVGLIGSAISSHD
jgi:hypothetical protein